jgi:hypothetical protein
MAAAAHISNSNTARLSRAGRPAPASSLFEALLTVPAAAELDDDAQGTWLSSSVLSFPSRATRCRVGRGKTAAQERITLRGLKRVPPHFRSCEKAPRRPPGIPPRTIPDLADRLSAPWPTRASGSLDSGYSEVIDSHWRIALGLGNGPPDHAPTDA